MTTYSPSYNTQDNLDFSYHVPQIPSSLYTLSNSKATSTFLGIFRNSTPLLTTKLCVNQGSSEKENILKQKVGEREEQGKGEGREKGRLIYVKELTHAMLGPGKSKICRAGQ